mgnify:CR=1 FL=1
MKGNRIIVLYDIQLGFVYHCISITVTWLHLLNTIGFPLLVVLSLSFQHLE